MSDRTVGEARSYAVAVLLLQAAYLASGILLPARFFGIHQLAYFGWIVPSCVIAFSWLLAVRMPPPLDVRPVPPWVLPSGFVVLGLALFLLFPSHALNPDGLALLEKIPRDVAARGAHVTHDEMLELYLHSRMYLYMNQVAGWSVADCYRVTSALSGGVFLILIVLLAGRMAPASQRPLFLAVALSGGYMQLFFGDVENYSLVATVMLAYVLAAYLHLSRHARLWVPSFVLATAIGFHLLAGWLLPSLVFLFWRTAREGKWRDLAWALVALVVPLACLLIFLHFQGLPIQRLLDSSHATGMGGHYARYLAPLDIEYIGGMANVVILLIPGVVLSPLLVYHDRLGSDPADRFLTIAALGMVAFTTLWRAQLGALQDWNLFAPGAAILALWIARGTVDAARRGPRGVELALWALAGSSAGHSAAWILRNHMAQRLV